MKKQKSTSLQRKGRLLLFLQIGAVALAANGGEMGMVFSSGRRQGGKKGKRTFSDVVGGEREGSVLKRQKRTNSGTSEGEVSV